MIQPLAYCPKCKNNVAFLKKDDLRECPVCGFQFSVGPAPSAAGPPPSAGHAVMTVLRAFLLAIAVVVGLAVVGLGVLFAGCALLTGGHIGH
jgi:hypothetical protein